MEKRLFLETVINSVRELDIAAIINKYTPLTRRGAHAHGLCPFHSDHSIENFI